jgi:lipoprotein-releasing system permease protein
VAVPYELAIGRRYLRSTRGRGFLSFIAVISMAGIAIGVATLLVVLSVMNGFEKELRSRILSVTAHATITGFGPVMPNWQELRERALRDRDVVGAAPYVEEQSLLVVKGATSGTLIRGVIPSEEANVSTIAQKMRAGSFDMLTANGWKIVLGSALADALHVKVGDKVVLMISSGTVTVAGVVPRMRAFTVVGIFESGMYEFDRNLAYVSLQDAERLFRMGDAVTGLRLKVTDMYAAPEISRALARALGGGFRVGDWTGELQNFFRSIQLTKTIMFLIFSLVVAVAAFNIVSTLVMVVKDKRSDIAILRTMGARPGSILKIFITQGTAIGFIGTLAGVLLGIVIAVNLESLVHGLEALLNTKFMDAKVYYMSDLPAEVQWADVLHVGLTSFILCTLSTIYPAWRAARTAPASALRHD